MGTRRPKGWVSSLDLLTKSCTMCRQTKTWAEFDYRTLPSGKESRTAVCKPCRKYRDSFKSAARMKHYYDNREAFKTHRLCRKYGILEHEYLALKEAQNNCCAICLKPECTIDKRSGKVRELAVDHCHASGMVRGLLCTACNQALGFLDDDVQRLARAQEYLREKDPQA